MGIPPSTPANPTALPPLAPNEHQPCPIHTHRWGDPVGIAAERTRAGVDANNLDSPAPSSILLYRGPFDGNASAVRRFRLAAPGGYTPSGRPQGHSGHPVDGPALHKPTLTRFTPTGSPPIPGSTPVCPPPIPTPTTRRVTLGMKWGRAGDDRVSRGVPRETTRNPSTPPSSQLVHSLWSSCVGVVLCQSAPIRCGGGAGRCGPGLRRRRT